jgi:hypothetical protein
MNGYILGPDGRTPVRCDDYMARHLNRGRAGETDNWRVARTYLSDEVYVSTVFLGLDHSFGGGTPVLFESMAFGGHHDQEWCERYHTWGEAENGHARMVERLRKSEEAMERMLSDLDATAGQ